MSLPGGHPRAPGWVGAGLLAGLAAGVGMLAHAGGGAHAATVAYAPRIVPAAFSTRIDNPYLPMRPGSRWVYEGRSDEGFERKVVEVTHDTRVVMGVPCVVVRDTVTLDGVVSEDTVDWYAQDGDGNVWNFGEATTKRTDTGVLTPAGSWEAGVGPAQPGIVMAARPAPGAPYRQEYLPGEAEDMARVLEVAGRTSVPAGEFDRVVVTRDWSPLEAGVADHKHYAPGVGMIREEAVEGEASRLDLVSVTG